MSMFYSEEVIDDYVECLSKLQTLDLTPEEQALFQSYAVVTCGRECLDFNFLTNMSVYIKVRLDHKHPNSNFCIQLFLHLIVMSRCETIIFFIKLNVMHPFKTDSMLHI